MSALLQDKIESGKTEWNYIPDQFRETFVSPWEQFKDRIGQQFTVLERFRASESDDGEEIIELYRIRFQDGTVIEAWPEEVCLADNEKS